MENTLKHEDLPPESVHLLRYLTDPYHRKTRNHEDPECTTTTHIEWISSKDFTVEAGHMQIHEYIRAWDLPPAWLFSLDYLGATKEDLFTFFYHFRARFSTPTERDPVVGTVGVYFTVNTVEPETLPVDVHFVIESNRLVTRAGSVNFMEKWLLDVIESKTLLRKTLQELWTDSV